MLFIQKEKYEDTVSTYSLMLLEGAPRLLGLIYMHLEQIHIIYPKSSPSRWCRWLIGEILVVTYQWLKSPRKNLGESGVMSSSLLTVFF